MPELPEVETIKLELERPIKNKKITSVEIRLTKEVKNSKSEFLKKVQGVMVKNVRRRAKTLIFDLDNGHHLVFHLKLTGQLIYRDKAGKLGGGGHPIQPDLEKLPNKYSHVIFNFSDGSRLFFNDLRQFGWVKLVNDDELAEMALEFGPEPLDKNFTFGKFKEIISKKKFTAIKPLLMDQKFLTGLGNIYAQEAVFCAGILPTRAVNKINESELKKLYQCLQKILKFAITKKGTSVDAYVDVFGRAGSMAAYLKVYGRVGEQCRRCGAIIKAIKQGSRTTCYCPKCQR